MTPTQSATLQSLNPAIADTQTLIEVESLKPLERLQVTDGLLITADHWQRAHQYHRHYQQHQYQALHQSGIVRGLGVTVISAPMDLPAEFRDSRWIKIQSGLAIDATGNLIVVPEPMDFRIASAAPTQGSAIVYIVLRYVDPDQLQLASTANSEFLQETFRIDETTNLPHPNDIILCRILLEPGEINLQPATNVFAPKVNQLDLRDRRIAQTKPALTVNVGTLAYLSRPESNPWCELMRSLTTLYPMMQGTVQSLQASAIIPALSQYDLIHFTQSQFVNLATPLLDTVQQAVQSGTVLLVEVSTKGSPIATLGKLHYELKQAIHQACHNLNNQALQTELETEAQATTNDLMKHWQGLIAELQPMATQLGIALEETVIPVETGGLDRSDPLRRQPFLFSQLPVLAEHPIYCWNFGSLIVILGDLSMAWQLDELCSESREQLRSRHEFGINLLQFAMTHRQLTQLQSPQATATIPMPTTSPISASRN